MEFSINPEERKILLSAALESIKAGLEGREPVYPQYPKTADSPLNKPCGAFVSLHTGRNLRGCIGRMTANLPLMDTVCLMAREAAFDDPRFPPLTSGELPRCHIEISVLSPMTLCSDPEQVKIGIHGLYLRKGGRSGVLLPQVPVEQGWNLSQYLEYICIKAGLPPGSYKAPDAELLTFTAIVFSQE
jgi:hypothetical protein